MVIRDGLVYGRSSRSTGAFGEQDQQRRCQCQLDGVSSVLVICRHCHGASAEWQAGSSLHPFPHPFPLRTSNQWVGQLQITKQCTRLFWGDESLRLVGRLMGCLRIEIVWDVASPKFQDTTEDPKSCSTGILRCLLPTPYSE